MLCKAVKRHKIGIGVTPVPQATYDGCLMGLAPLFESEKTCGQRSDDCAVRSKKKRVKGIEPSPKAWEAFILPLNYTRTGRRLKLSSVTAAVKRMPSMKELPLDQEHHRTSS